jgi:hypothetical protein
MMEKRDMKKVSEDFKAQLAKQGFTTDEIMCGGNVTIRLVAISREAKNPDEAGELIADFALRLVMVCAEQGLDIKRVLVVNDLVLNHMCKVTGVDPETIYKLELTFI